MATPPKLCGDCGTQMEPMPETYALVGFEKTEKGFQFNSSKAVPVTVYLCPKCGRFKFMSALMLGNLTAGDGSEIGAPDMGAPGTDR